MFYGFDPWQMDPTLCSITGFLTCWSLVASGFMLTTYIICLHRVVAGGKKWSQLEKVSNIVTFGIGPFISTILILVIPLMFPHVIDESHPEAISGARNVGGMYVLDMCSIFYL